MGNIRGNEVNLKPKTGGTNHHEKDIPISTNALDQLDREDLVKMVKSMLGGGIVVGFNGKRTALEISKKVRPRITRRIADLHVGTPEAQSKNILLEGENLQAMVTLYKYRGQVDLIVTDPPYNTGQYFRYNDRWDEDPNDPDLGNLVRLEDSSRHTKWMKAMMPRLQMMKAMLKPQGVMAICIDENELFHLGMMMDEVFGEENRIAIINWQKSYAAKNDSKHVSTATEYVLVYAREKQLAKTGLTPRTATANAKYLNPDNDPLGPWRSGSPLRRESRDHDKYGIQSPFTGAIHYPGAKSWRIPKKRIKEMLEMWGSSYIEKDIADGRAKALVVQGAVIPADVVKTKQNLDHFPVIEMDGTQPNKINVKSRCAAELIRDNKPWPVFYFGDNGLGRPNIKFYLGQVKKGMVPLTYWADDEYMEPLLLGTQSWDHEESGHSQMGINELDAVVGKGHQFDTVKPLKLIKKIIQIWCPSKGLVMDPYAGSGTTGHAVLELNNEAETDRRFILIEQGRPEKGDKYARTLTHTRLKRVILGLRADKSGRVTKTAKPLGGGFEFRALTNQIDAKAVLSMRRDELVDVMITSHWETGRRNSPNLIRVEDPAYSYLVGKNERGEGYFIIWQGDGPVGQLDSDTYRVVLEEGKKAGLKPPYHVYARYEVYQSKNVFFYKIPDKILAHLGLNENSDCYNEVTEGE